MVSNNATIDTVMNATLNVTEDSAAEDEDWLMSFLIIIWMCVASFIALCCFLCIGWFVYHKVCPGWLKMDRYFTTHKNSGFEGIDEEEETITFNAAQKKCIADKKCQGFQIQGDPPAKPNDRVTVQFKKRTEGQNSVNLVKIVPKDGFTCYVKEEKEKNLFVKPGGMQVRPVVPCVEAPGPQPDLTRSISSNKSNTSKSMGLNITDQKEHLGVNVQYIVEEFEKEALQAVNAESNHPSAVEGKKLDLDSDPNFHIIAQHLFYGSNGKGFGKICPRDRRKGCAFVDALPSKDRGFANYFMSWVWSYSLSTFTGAIGLWIKHTSFSPDEVNLWVCAFCNNQYRIMDEKNGKGSDLLGVFEQRLKDIGSCVALLDTWQDPVYTKRVWCIFEQYTAVKNDIPVHIILPPKEAQSMHAALEQNMAKIIGALHNIDVESAEASFKEDEDKVKATINSDVGFDAVNQAVKQSLTVWFQQEFQSFMKKVAAAPRSSLTRNITPNSQMDYGKSEQGNPDMSTDNPSMSTNDIDNVMCIICMARKKTHVLVPCGHKVVCEHCADRLKECPLCRSHVAQIIKVFE